VNHSTSVRLALAWCILAIPFLCAATPLPGLQYPGTPPGATSLRLGDDTLTASNAALAVSWTFHPNGLRLRTIRDVSQNHILQYTGEVFRIVFTNGHTVAASSLRIQGEPALTDSPPALCRPGKQIALSLRSEDGLVNLRWRVLAPDNANYIRECLDILPETTEVIREIQWFDQVVYNACTAGAVDGSPVVLGATPPFAGQNFSSEAPQQRALFPPPLSGTVFLACEDPHAINEALSLAATNTSQARVFCRLPRNAPVPAGETLTQSFVIGVAPQGQLRRAFLYYLERERAHPYRPYLHYNSWYDTAWDPFTLNETNCLEAIKLMGENLVRARQVKIDGMVFDDGWDNPQTLWKFHAGFPNGFTPLSKLCEQYDTRLGVWLSPFGGYGEPREKRLQFGRQQGYEINAAGFSLAGPKYYAAFKNACIGMIRNYRVNHFKFDGIAAGMSARGAAQYVLDTEAMRRLMLDLRSEDPNVFINLTTGSWPSPFWLRFADSVWRQGGDMGSAGVGTRQQQWITYRDQETYRNIVQRGPLYPLNSLMTQGVAYSRKGHAGDPSFNSAGFEEDVRSFFASGTDLQELYIQPGRLTPKDWDVLAESAKWSRAHADILVDTHWIGGDPGALQPYGYASWSPRKGIIMLRNPSNQPRTITIDVGTAFELPPGTPTKYLLTHLWKADQQDKDYTAQDGHPLTLSLGPLQIRVFEAHPQPFGS
jgi:hypothetical protein